MRLAAAALNRTGEPAAAAAAATVNTIGKELRLLPPALKNAHSDVVRVNRERASERRLVLMDFRKERLMILVPFSFSFVSEIDWIDSRDIAIALRAQSSQTFSPVFTAARRSLRKLMTVMFGRVLFLECRVWLAG